MQKEINSSTILFHSSSQSQLLTPAPEQNLLGVMGVSDWDFLCPATSTTPTEDGEGREKRSEVEGEAEDTTKRPSLDDFDGEIAVFQVSSYSLAQGVL